MKIDEAHLAALVNPTGLPITPTPWTPGPDEIDLDAGFTIEAPPGHTIATFSRKPDRDLAIYFVNVHAATIALLRSISDQFRFLAHSANDPGASRFAAEVGEAAKLYGECFAALGKITVQQEEGDGEDQGDQRG